MTSSKREFGPAWLLAILAVASAPRLWLAVRQMPGYDNYWHVWIAQLPFRNFVEDYRNTAHPPLYFGMLRLMLMFGRSPLIYRAISIAAGLGSIWIVGLIACKIMRSKWMPQLTALAYGIALPSILISDEVRAYMPAVFLTLVAYYLFLDEPATRARTCFAISISLAMLTQYNAAFPFAAMACVVFAADVLGRPVNAAKRFVADVLTFALALALPALEYVTHFKGARGVEWSHLTEFYFNPAGAESAGGFLLRGLRSEFNLFLPARIQNPAVFAGVLVALAMFLIAGAWLLRRSGTAQAQAALKTLAVTLLIVGEIFAAALARAYPFGGYLRQQYILFPFLALSAFILVDCFLCLAPARIAQVVTVLLAALACWVGVDCFANYLRVFKPDPFDVVQDAGRMQRYNSLFPNPSAIYIDQYNLIVYFAYHDQWDWRFLRHVPDSPARVDSYDVTKGTKTVVLFRDKARWNLDFDDPTIYNPMAAALRTSGVDSLTTFGIRQIPGRPRSRLMRDAFRSRIINAAADAGLSVDALTIDGYDVYAQFRLTRR